MFLRCSLLGLLSAGVLAVQAHAAPRPTLAEPAMSPDRAEIAFVAGGDIWTPSVLIQGADGKDMELNPRPVDVHVQRALGEAGKDGQLDAAVAELLKGVGQGQGSSP